MNAAQILRVAAGHVRHGWCQDTLFDAEKSCAMGAMLRIAQSGACTMTDATRAAEFLATKVLGTNLPAWNDKPDQTAENVADTMEFAALIFEHEAQSARSSDTRQLQDA